MNLRTYFMGVLENPAQRAEFAKRAGTSKTYVHQLICKTPKAFRTPGRKLALALHEASGGVISLHSMRPDLWPQ